MLTLKVKNRYKLPFHLTLNGKSQDFAAETLEVPVEPGKLEFVYIKENGDLFHRQVVHIDEHTRMMHFGDGHVIVAN